MCLSKAYVDKNGGLLMEEIVSVEIKGERLLLRTLFGEQKEMRANIKRIDFLTHSIFLENITNEEKLKGV